MSLEKMFTAIDDLGQVASANAILGEPQTVEGKTLIPVAAVSKGFALSFEQEASQEDESNESAAEHDDNVGGLAASRPVAVLELSDDNIVVRPITDETKVSIAGIALFAWVVFWVGATIRSVFGKKA